MFLFSRLTTRAAGGVWRAFGDEAEARARAPFSLPLAPRSGKFAYDMVHVAGDRVTTDPVAVPFSKGRNLLCIYSKRHMNNPPELASKKKMHNARRRG